MSGSREGRSRARFPAGGEARLPGAAGMLLLGAAALVIGFDTARGQATAPAECTGIDFREVAAEVGIDFVHDRGAEGEYELPETIGAGLAWIDHDDDGFLDLYVVQSGPFPPEGGAGAANRLFRNLGDGRFAEVADAAGAADTGYGQGVVAGDLDGDGLQDLFVTNYGANSLYLNRGGRFEPVPLEAAGDAWSTSAAMADVDGDTDLDVYVTNYVVYDRETAPRCRGQGGERDYCHPDLFAAAPDQFLRNPGDGTLIDATAEAGLDAAAGKGLGVVMVDLDGDADADIYVANDATPNLLYANDGSGRFTDVSLLSATAVNYAGVPEAGMGLDVADIDGDGLPEIGVTNLEMETNTLYLNEGALRFVDDSARTGFGLPSFTLLGFGLLLDDLDGDLITDAYVANGHVLERPEREGSGHAQRDLLLLGTGDGHFVEARCGPAIEELHVSRALAAADYDDDGDLDLAISGSGEPLRLLRNDAPSGRWLGLELRGAGANTDAVGARVELITPQARRTVWSLRGESYLASGDPRVLFALPRPLSGDEVVEITWPNGESSRVPVSPEMLGRYSPISPPARPPGPAPAASPR